MSQPPGAAMPAPMPAPMRIGDRLFAWGRRTYLMGIVNATPDSFAGDGVLDPARAAEQAARMVAEGADLIDLGAESTRPGHAPLDAAAEWARLEPVLRAVRAAVPVPITVDTTKAEVAARAFAAGADALNDVHGLRGDVDLAPLLARTDHPAIVMHNQRGRARTGTVIADVRAGLEASLAVATAAGVRAEQLVLDPGFGFGWEPDENLELVRELHALRALGRPLLLGPSRKSTIGLVLDRPVDARAWGTAALVALAIAQGVHIVRVHDVPEMVDVARMADAVMRGWARPA